MNAKKVLVSAMRELLGTGKTASQVAASLSYPNAQSSAELAAVSSLFAADRGSIHESTVAARLDSLLGVSDTAGGTLTASGSGGLRVYVVS